MRQVPVTNRMRQVLLFPFQRGGNLGLETLLDVFSKQGLWVKRVRLPVHSVCLKGPSAGMSRNSSFVKAPTAGTSSSIEGLLLLVP